ncbi:MAG: hypothetical protein IKF90_13700 [Parasporobacterium sp.]|nr:hypothetical protein [Parasporobacterium sp.]
MVCPLTCPIVKEALKVPGQMHEYVDYHKQHCSRCMECIRNEYATLPENEQKDMGKEE